MGVLERLLETGLRHPIAISGASAGAVTACFSVRFGEGGREARRTIASSAIRKNASSARLPGRLRPNRDARSTR